MEGERWQVGHRAVEPHKEDLNVKIDVLGDHILIYRGNEVQKAYASFDGKWWWVWWDGITYRIKSIPPSRSASFQDAETIIRAPMTGTITSVMVKQGKEIKAGDTLIRMEAMKMEYTLKASIDGLVEAIFCKVGDVVESDQVLVEIKP